ncbi:MAG: lipid-A-disaccharide synthase [bacterium]|nr:lipid-A-disaccharide synthase [bacterium]
MTVNFFLSAGETSGDMYGAELIRALRAEIPDVAFVGLGGREMAAAEMELICDAETHGVVGLTDVIGNIFRLKHDLDLLTAELKARRPDCLIVIDYGGFNARLLARAKKLGIKTVYYIPPKVWAWGRGRGKAIAKNADLIACIFPFEVDFWQGFNGSVEFVGHPLLGLDAGGDTDIRMKYGVGDGKLIAVLPGSRRSEIKTLLPVMAEAVGLLRRDFPDAKFILGAAPGIPAEEMTGYIGDERIEIERDNVTALMRDADVALVASGTATLQLALYGTPMVIAYRANPITAFVARRVMRVEWLGLPNLIADKEIVREFLQEELSADNLTRETARILSDVVYRRAMLTDLARVRDELSSGGGVETAPVRTAKLICERIL